MQRDNSQFEIRGINHLALVCKDMQRTVDFYEGVLGMQVIKTIELPGNLGQHFFFDIGNGDSLAFFWFPKSPDAMPGVSSPTGMPGEGELETAHGSMNHVAFDVPSEKFDEYHAKLSAKGVHVTPILNHDDSPRGMSREVHEGTFIRSFYFMDPDGILLEFATWLRAMRPDDVKHAPVTARDKDRYLGLVPAGD
jgi:catechol 2,3-dioxygenase-like lactoylglutathione lyase family enzyme